MNWGMPLLFEGTFMVKNYALFGYILYVIISAREPSAQHHCHFGVFSPIFVAQNRGSFLQPRQEIPKWINLINYLRN